jgi:hypothetical protein
MGSVRPDHLLTVEKVSSANIRVNRSVKLYRSLVKHKNKMGPTVLGIRDILDPDPGIHIYLTNEFGSDSFSVTLRMQKIDFSSNLPTDTLSSILNLSFC